MIIHKIPSSNSQGVRPALIKHFLIDLAKAVCVVVVLSNLSACSRGKVIVTSDDSVEYKSARSLPPLIKPTQGTTPSTAPAPSTVPTVSQVEPISNSEPIVDSVSESDLRDDTEAVVAVAPSGLKSTSIQSNLNAVLDTKSNSTRLSIDSDWDGAWAYLIEKLKDSDLTVFSRNKTAGRIAIGCSEVGEEVTETKAGRWSIFNRKKVQASEYCSLQMNKKGGDIQVSVLDRVGVEASVDKARLVLEKLET